MDLGPFQIKNLASLFRLLATVLLLLLHTPLSQSAIYVYFYGNPHGSQNFETHSRFYHAALFDSTFGLWLDAHPPEGVRMRKVPPYPQALAILQSPVSQLNWPALQNLRGQKFNLIAPWNSMTETYCSKVLAQIFHLQPRPMDFSGSYWLPYKKSGMRLPQGEPGISPDEVYWQLRQKGFRVIL